MNPGGHDLTFVEKKIVDGKSPNGGKIIFPMEKIKLMNCSGR